MGLIKLTLDFETYYAKDYTLSMRSMTLAKYIMDTRFKAHGVGIKIDNKPGSWVTHSDLPKLFDRIPWDRVMLIGHNLKFDASILAWRYGKYPAVMADTKCMARALLGNVPANFQLGTISQFLIGMDKGKELPLSFGIRNLPPHIEEKIAGYCVYNTNSDINLTYEICKILWPFFPKNEVPVMDWTLRMFTEPKLRLNKARLLAYRDSVIAHKKKLLDDLSRRYPPDVFTSNPKFADLLRSFNVEPPTKESPTTHKETYAFAKTDEDFLALLDHPNPDVGAIVEARMGLKTSQAETRALSYAEHADLGPWPVDIEYCGALATHRFSGARGGGGNPQNMQRGTEIRKSVEAPDGYVVMPGDSSAIELRTAMTLAGQEDAVELLRNGVDIYCWFASNLYGRTITKKDEAERFLGKLACLSLQYGCGKDKFRKIAGLKGVRLTVEESEQIVNTYRRTFYMIPRFWQICNNAILAMYRGEFIYLPPANIVYTGTDKFFGSHFGTMVPAIHLPGGLNLRYPGLRKNSNEEWVYLTRTNRTEHETKLYGGKLTENICQALAGRIIANQGVTLPKHLRPVLQVHDELVPVVPEETAKEERDFLERHMSKPPDWWPNLPIAAEVKYNKLYGEAK